MFPALLCLKSELLKKALIFKNTVSISIPASSISELGVTTMKVQSLVSMIAFLAAITLFSCTANTNSVTVVEKEDGWRLMVNGEAVMVNGMNWDYFPIGTNYEYVLWEESDDFIKRALNYEMGKLQAIGVNAIRVYTGITPRWITYIYDNFGIYTMLNHSFGRYGLTIDGEWVPATDYASPAVIEMLLGEVTDIAREFKGTRGLLLYLLGNENNFGLFWGGPETENIPMHTELYEDRARDMYRLFNRAALEMRAIDATRPIAMANGDIQFLDIIAVEMPDMDILGVNVYRGASFRDLYQRVKDEYGKPILLTEVGADAYNAKEDREDQMCQAYYVHANWREIYMYAAGMGDTGNSLGAFTFQSSDGWWKFGQTIELDVHHTNASWANAGYQCDYVAGEYNMNEEWFGVMAKGATDEYGHYPLFPRAAYFVLQEAHQFDPYAPGASLETLNRHFEHISLEKAYKKAKERNENRKAQ